MKKLFYLLIFCSLIFSASGYPRVFAADLVGVCIKDGNRTATTEEACLQMDGSWLSENPTTGEDLVGVCFKDGNRTATTEEACLQMDGSWLSETPGSGSDTPLAGENTNYQLLSPLPCDENTTPGCTALESFDTGATNNFGVYLNTMLRIFIGICAVLAVIMIVVGGLQYMTSELVSNKEEGKSRIKHAILGLLLALGAYTILFQINPKLLDTDVNFVGTCTVSGEKRAMAKAECEAAGGTWAPQLTVTVDIDDDVPQTPVNGKYTHSGTQYDQGADWVEVAGRGEPKGLPAGMTLNNSECQTVGQSNCTSTVGLSWSYLETIKSKCAQCNNFVITGGTEFWLHGGTRGTSHGPGSPTVDLRKNDKLTSYIVGNKQPKYYNRYVKDGISFLYEGDHWHAGP